MGESTVVIIMSNDTLLAVRDDAPLAPVRAPLPWSDAVRAAFVQRIVDANATAHVYRPRYPRWKWIVHCAAWAVAAASALTLVVFFIVLGVLGRQCDVPGVPLAECGRNETTSVLYARIGHDAFLSWICVPAVGGSVLAALLIGCTMIYGRDTTRWYMKPRDPTCDPLRLLFHDPQHYAERVGADAPHGERAARGCMTWNWFQHRYHHKLADFLELHRPGVEQAEDVKQRDAAITFLAATFYDRYMVNHGRGEYVRFPCHQ
jgi:hypothetical protein